MWDKMNLVYSVLYLLSALFGLSSWIAINGLWVETPILVNTLPESWKLASYITLIIQLANVGPLLYWVLKRFSLCKNYLEQISIHFIYLIGIVSLFLLAFFWEHVSVVAGQSHSVSLLVLTFFLAIVDCTSSVLYIPFMSNIPRNFLVSHLIGQALSGLIPSFIALAQGVGGNPECVYVNNTIQAHYLEPRFSVNVFMLLLAVLAIISWLSFLCLANLKRFVKLDTGEYEIVDDHYTVEESTNETLSGKTVLILLVTEAVICSLTNGMLPPIQPYSVLYYGNVTYHFVVTLAAISSPVGCLLTLLPIKKTFLLLKLSMLGATLAAVYIVLAALHSPYPLIDNHYGQFLIVLMWICTNLFFSFARTTITKLLRSQNNSHRLLFKGGVFTQLGSSVGAMLMFYIINYTNIFVSFNPCESEK